MISNYVAHINPKLACKEENTDNQCYSMWNARLKDTRLIRKSTTLQGVLQIAKIFFNDKFHMEIVSFGIGASPSISLVFLFFSFNEFSSPNL
jgi:hypothetical protein